MSSSQAPRGNKNFLKKKEEVVDPFHVPKNLIHFSTFLGRDIPEEVRMAVPLLHAATASTFRAIMLKVLQHFNDTKVTDDGYSEFMKKISSATNDVQSEDISTIFSALYTLFRVALSGKHHISVMKADMLKMNFPQTVADDISKAFMAYRSTMEEVIVDNRISFSRLEKLRWRIDVAISSGSLSRVMRPSILMQIIMSNGEFRVFEVSIEQFNQLRYGVAKVLFDMQTIERHPIVKLVGELEKRDVELRSKI